MNWVNVLWACDFIAIGVGACVYVWAGVVAWRELRRPPAVRRDPGHYGTRVS